MRRAAITILAGAVVALVAALGFVRAADRCATTLCVYVPLIRAVGGPVGAPEPTQPPPASTVTNTPVIGITRTITPGPSPTNTGTPTNTRTATTTPSSTRTPTVTNTPPPTATPTLPPPTATPTLPPPSYDNCQTDPGPNAAPNYPIKITNIDKSNETVTLKNLSANSINLTGWNMCSIKGNQHHPISGTLAPGASQTFPGPVGSIWNNTSFDPGALYNPNGQLVSYFGG